MKVCVVGLGYIGLPTASILASKGFSVCGVDVDKEHVARINQGQIHIAEPDLDILVRAAVQSSQLTAALEPQAADIFIVAVPTPFKGGHVPDMSYLRGAVTMLAPYLKPGDLVLLESTIPVGVTEWIGNIIQNLRPDLKLPEFKPWGSGDAEKAREGNIFLAHCPERVLPGQILKELIDNDRVVGGLDRASGLKAKAFYEKFVNGKVYVTDARTAELCKLTENAFRDVNIAFANELSMVCEQFNINVWELIDLANRHPRVNILTPGPGVGGHCIAVDPWFIVHSAPEQARLIKMAREVNDTKPDIVIGKIKQKASRFIRPVIACLGLAFKADIGDMRESPALRIVSQLVKEDVGSVIVVEPHVESLPTVLAGEEVVLADLAVALTTADIIVLLVDHRDFREINKEVLKEKVIIDTRGLWR